MIALERPGDFNPVYTVVSCFLFHAGEILVVRRAPWKLEGGLWGVPAGKVNDGETLEDAIVREMGEETGIKLDCSLLRYGVESFVRYSDYDFVFHIYTVELGDERPMVVLNPEELTDYAWMTPKDALEIDMVRDGIKTVEFACFGKPL